MAKMKEEKKELHKVELSQKEQIIEWLSNALAFIMLVAFFLKIVFF